MKDVDDYNTENGTSIIAPQEELISPFSRHFRYPERSQASKRSITIPGLPQP